MGWGSQGECQQSPLLPDWAQSHSVTPALRCSGYHALFTRMGYPLKPRARISPSILAGFVRSHATAMGTVTHAYIGPSSLLFHTFPNRSYDNRNFQEGVNSRWKSRSYHTHKHICLCEPAPGILGSAAITASPCTLV